MTAIPRRIASTRTSPSSSPRRALRASVCVAALSCVGIGLAEAKNFDVLYAFCSKSGCSDGKEPMAPLISDSHGNLYGTTFGGGSAGSGTVFALVPNTDGSGWTHKVLYNFCSAEACSDGEFPNPGALAIDSRGKPLRHGPQWRRIRWRHRLQADSRQESRRAVDAFRAA